jgi:hypothetical protein
VCLYDGLLISTVVNTVTILCTTDIVRNDILPQTYFNNHSVMF